MGDIYLFRRWPLIHDLGHAVISTVASLAIWWLTGWGLSLAFFLGCTATATVLEGMDIYFGGIVVTHSQRVRILQSRIANYGYRPSPDNVKDWLNYQVPWLFAFAWGGDWLNFWLALVVLYGLHMGFYFKVWSW